MKTHQIKWLGIILLMVLPLFLAGCGGGGSDSTSKPTPINQAPVANAGADHAVDEGAQDTLTGSGSDADGTIVSYAWTQTSGPAVALDSPNSATTTYTAPDVSAATTLTFQLTVTDNEGATGSDSVTVTVNPIIVPPTADAGADHSVEEKTVDTLTGSGTDTDGTIVAYAWAQTAGPAVTLNAPNSATTTYTAPAVSTATALTFKLTVTDNDGATGSDTVTVTVNPAAVVSVTVSTDNPYVSSGRSLQFTATATYSDSTQKDVTADATWSTSDAGVATIAAGGKAEGTAPGTARITANFQGTEGTLLLTVGNQVGGVGATVPWVEYEAENAPTDGSVIGPSRAQYEIAEESSGRKAVKLDQTGQHVSFTTTEKANSIVVRYVIPDAPGGGGMSATLGLYVNGTRIKDLQLTSKYSWLYGTPDSGGFWTNNTPGANPHRFYDEVHILTGDIPAGATVTLQKDAQDMAAYYVIDFIDLEQVSAPLPQPADSLSITDFGATPDDGTDDSAAIQNAASTAFAQGKGLWIPVGTFTMNSARLFIAGGLDIHGAGMWYSVLTGPNAEIRIAGTATHVNDFASHISDFAIFAEETFRNDSGGRDGIAGQWGTNSTIDNLWVEHVLVGFPVVGTDLRGGGGAGEIGRTTGLHIQGTRVRDTYADGFQLTGGVTNSVVEQSTTRNTGDDSFVDGSLGVSETGTKPNSHNIFRFDTAQMPWAAHCFGIYGGDSLTVEDSLCVDTINDSAMTLAEFFGSYSFTGTTTIQRLSFVRCGGTSGGAQKRGALTFDVVEQPINNTMVIKDVLIQDSTFAGIQVQGPNMLTGLAFENVLVINAGADGIRIDANAMGSATATALIVISPQGKGLSNLAPKGNWTFVRGDFNSGW